MMHLYLIVMSVTYKLLDACFQIITYLGGTERAGQRLSHHEYFVSGACTGFVASFAEGPIDLVSETMHSVVGRLLGEMIVIALLDQRFETHNALQQNEATS